MSANYRSNNELANEVDKFDRATPAGLSALEILVRSSWTVREIDQFKSFLHGGDFRSPAGWERNGQSGIIASTKAEDSELQRLWDGLLALAWRLVGAASALHIERSKPFKWLTSPRWANHAKRGIITGDINPLGDDDKLLDMTISELIQRIGNAYEAMTKTQSRLQKKLDAYNAKFGPLDD